MKWLVDRLYFRLTERRLGREAPRGCRVRCVLGSADEKLIWSSKRTLWLPSSLWRAEIFQQCAGRGRWISLKVGNAPVGLVLA